MKSATFTAIPEPVWASDSGGRMRDAASRQCGGGIS